MKSFLAATAMRGSLLIETLRLRWLAGSTGSADQVSKKVRSVPGALHFLISTRIFAVGPDV
jgi:hypothetical protein